MAGFLYLIPPDGDTPPHLRGESVSRVGVTMDGTRHAMIVPECAQRPRIGYHADRQRWTQCDGWRLGYETDHPPSPADLARPRMIDGHAVTLGDGNEWVIPLAVVVRFVEDRITRTTALPQRLGLDESGHWVAHVLPEYLQVSRDAERMYQHLIGQGPAPAIAEALDVAARALAINYRVSRWECSALGMFTTENLPDVLRALVDWPTIEAWLAEKKTTAGPRSIAHGEAA